MSNSRDSAQRRVDQVRAFRAELDALTTAGVSAVTPERRAAIDAYHDALLERLAAAYDVDRSDAAGRLSRGMQVASFFAAATLTAAIYSLVARFWGRLDLPLQATLLAAFPLISLIGVELSARRERTLYVASLFAVVAYGTFWLAAWVLSWTLNIPWTPHVIWAGALFGLALALPYGFRVVLAVALMCVTVAVPASAFQAAGVPWTEIATRPEMSVVVGFVLTALAPRLAQHQEGFGPVVRLVGFGVGLAGLLWMTSAGEYTLLPLSARVAEGVSQGVMLVACVALVGVAIARHWSETVNLAAGFLAIFLLSRFVDWFWDALPRYVFFLLLAAIACGWLVAMRQIRDRLRSQ